MAELLGSRGRGRAGTGVLSIAGALERVSVGVVAMRRRVLGRRRPVVGVALVPLVALVPTTVPSAGSGRARGRCILLMLLVALIRRLSLVWRLALIASLVALVSLLVGLIRVASTASVVVLGPVVPLAGVVGHASGAKMPLLKR